MPEGNPSFDIKVKINYGYASALPFGNQLSRQAQALILGYTGYRHEVIPKLQKISHKSRAFISLNAKAKECMLSHEI